MNTYASLPRNVFNQIIGPIIDRLLYLDSTGSPLPWMEDQAKIAWLALVTDLGHPECGMTFDDLIWLASAAHQTYPEWDQGLDRFMFVYNVIKGAYGNRIED